MGTSALRQLLESLCHDSIWNYAVLWKLRHENPMILTWEDGCFNYPKPRELALSMTNVVCCKGAADIFSQFETSASSGTLEDHPIELLGADMLHLQYALGEGVVGSVALTRVHFWVSFNNFFTGDVRLISKCPEEWLLQFASGIKTILLVPVLPHGVLQLGSLKEFAEDVDIVENVKGRFHVLHNVTENTSTVFLKEEFQAEPSSPVISSAIECLNAPSTTAFASVKTTDSNYSVSVNSVEIYNNNPPAASQVLPLVNIEYTCMTDGKDLLEAPLHYERENRIDVPPINLADISAPSVSINADQLEMVESKLFELSCLMEELKAYSDCNDYNIGTFGESSNGIMSSYPDGEIAGEPSGGKATMDTDNKVIRSFVRFPKDSELHEVLGPKQTNEKLWDSSFLVEDTCRTSCFTCNKDPSKRTEPSWFAIEGDAGYLLEAVVANACSGSDDTSIMSDSFKTSTSFSGHFNASPKAEKELKASKFVKDDSTPWNHLRSACFTGDKNAENPSSTLRSMMDTIFSKEQHEKGSDGAHGRKGHKTTVSKRRAKPGDNQRPRPRDRQLIQDRVKELRELVPNSAKCSIDGLLDRTIRHMLYLRSVTDQADKLRQCMHQEVDSQKNWSSYNTKENCQNGTSWAYEFGNEFLACPILVEDLACPGHMLIEMLCNENCLFLEIAQVIRGLELTILKGVLESRSSNTWARFVVEGSKGFHRLDIFWPLMQLLQRKRSPLSSKI